MDCIEYRRAVLADPQADLRPLAEHRANCEECSRYAAAVRRFEGRIERALTIPVDPRSRGGAAHAERAAPLRLGPPRRVRWQRRWQAAAASLLVAAVLGGVVWMASPGRTLAADVVGHMAGEPDAWVRTDSPVAPAELAHVLAEAHVRLRESASLGSSGIVSYARDCLFRGHLVPHLVIQSDSGPMTVMLLPDEAVRTAVRFDERGYRGIIVPGPGRGSIAVLERGSTLGSTTALLIADRLRNSLEYSG